MLDLGPYGLMREPGPQRDGLLELIRLLPDNCIMAEIGSCRGDAAELFLCKAARLFCIDIWADYIERGCVKRSRSHEVEAAFDKFAARFPSVIEKIKLPSLQAVEQFKRHSLDVVYLDGDHDVEVVKAEIKVWKDKIKPGGILAGHDYWPDDPVLTGPRVAVHNLLGGPDKIFVDSSWMRYV